MTWVKSIAKEGNDNTLAILKFSYNYLTPALKSCFSYCALFSKGCFIKKDELIDLWMANGCFVPQYEDQSIEDIGEEYFSILLQRCFFQNITEDSGMIFCKVHDLMHDLASEAAGHELVMLLSTPSHLDRRTRHLSISEGCHVLNSPHNLLTKMKKMRTFLQIPRGLEWPLSNATRLILSNCKCLWWLDLRGASLRALPNGIGRLIHLRCLDLSFNGKLEILPESITSLQNLQLLKLKWCNNLQKLPKHFSKLVNLRHLDIDHCLALTYMPTGLKNLTCLHRLSTFVVSGDPREVQMHQLNDLKALVNLRGRLIIRVVNFSSNEMSKLREGAYLLNKPHLKHLEIQFEGDNQGGGDVQEALLEGFQPKGNLISMKVAEYKGEKLASWMLQEDRMRALLSHLVTVELEGLPRVEHLPLLSQLCRLRELYIRRIPSLEYMESDNNYAASADLTFFPSLEVLSLYRLPKMKGWWRDGVVVNGSDLDGVNGYGNASLSFFPRLCELVLDSCQAIKSLPPCPAVKVLSLFDLNELPSFTEKRAGVDNHNHLGGLCTTASSSPEIGVASIPDDSCCVMPPVFALKELMTNIAELRLPKESVQGLTRLKIQTFDDSLSAFQQVFRSCVSSLQILEISHSLSLKTLHGGGIEQLTCLQNLQIRYANQLELEDEDEPWKSPHNLSSLTLAYLPNLVKLPRGLQYLTSLQSISIEHSGNLRTLPTWLACLTSLRFLNIEYCRKLTSSQGRSNLAPHTQLTFTEYHPLPSFAVLMS